MAVSQYANFNYLDHLDEFEIDVSSYLTLFSDSNYQLKFSNFQKIKTNVKNFFNQRNLIGDYKAKSGAYVKYSIQAGELPEDISTKFYGSEDFWWIITLYNDIHNPLIEWPLSNNQIDYLADLYVSTQDKYSKQGYKLLLEETSLARQEIDVLQPSLIQDLIFALQFAIFTVDDDKSAYIIKI